MSRTLVPLVGISVVLGMALGLIVVVTLKPWATADESPETILRFREQKLDTYTRTRLTWIGEEYSAPVGWEPTNHGPEANHGYTLYVASGCASCHGLEAQGSAAVVTPLAGKDPQIVEFFVRQGPGGMPAYHADELPQADLEAIAGYLAGLSPLPTLTPPVPVAPTPTPWPQSDGAPTPTPGDTAKPTVSPEDIAAGKALFMDRALGCSLCHPSGIEGVESRTAEEIATALRQGVGIMQPFSEKKLSDEELAQIIAYLQNPE